MENKEPWEPTFPAGYTFSPENVYGGSGSACPSPGPAYLARGPAVDILAAPMTTATVAVLVSTTRAELVRRSSGVRGSSGGASGGGGNLGHRGGGVGSGGEGEKERLNAMEYNNAYVDGRWGIFWHAGAMRPITHKASLAGRLYQ